MEDKVKSKPIQLPEGSLKSCGVQLKNVDSFLRCTICYEYYNTCVLTPCSHNFCSLCIRKYVQHRSRCPTCFRPIRDRDLKPNRLVDNLVGIFPNAQDKVMSLISILEANGVTESKMKKTEQQSTSETVTTEVSKSADSVTEGTATNIADTTSKSNEDCSTLKDVMNIAAALETPGNSSINHQSSSDAFELVACPVCHVDVPERNINLHLDACLKRDARMETVSRREYLPRVTFRIMTEEELKNTASKYGLKTTGDLFVLKSRIQRYIAYYNAECDKEFPRPVEDIKRLVDTEEACTPLPSFPSVTTTLPQHFPVFTRHRHFQLPPRSFDGSNRDYLAANKSSFDRLISSIKGRNGQPLMAIDGTSMSGNCASSSASGSDANNGGGNSNDNMPSTSSSSPFENEFFDSTSSDNDNDYDFMDDSDSLMDDSDFDADDPYFAGRFEEIQRDVRRIHTMISDLNSEIPRIAVPSPVHRPTARRRLALASPMFMGRPFYTHRQLSERRRVRALRQPTDDSPSWWCRYERSFRSNALRAHRPRSRFFTSTINSVDYTQSPAKCTRSQAKAKTVSNDAASSSKAVNKEAEKSSKVTKTLKTTESTLKVGECSKATKTSASIFDEIAEIPTTSSSSSSDQIRKRKRDP